MGICLQAAYRQAFNKSVPAPWDVDAKGKLVTPDVDVWYDRIAKLAQHWATIGITAVMLPPVFKTNAGRYIGADGYGVYDDFDIGSKNQYFSRETRFGNREQLQRCIAIFAANGIDTYADMVPHQRMGDPGDGNFKYLGADGKSFNGRFAKSHSYFLGDPAKGWSSHDPIAGPLSDDFSFGRESCFINSKPHDAYAQGMIAAGDWLTRTLGLEGYRNDDTKGQNAGFVKRWSTSLSMKGKYCVGEYADGNPNNLNWWVSNSGIDGVCSAFDFSIHYLLEAMCNSGGRWDMRQLVRGGLCGVNPTRAMTFVETPDTDTNGFAGIKWNKAAAYFVIMTFEGYPCVSFKDWSDDPGCYGWGMQPHIENYCWINRQLAAGSTAWRYADEQLLVYERLGGPGLLAAVNNAGGGWHSLWVETAFGPNVELHDYTGHADNVWTNVDGWVEIGVPPNVNGLGTVAYSRVGLDGPIKVEPRRIVQTFFGAFDLDIGPIAGGHLREVGSIWCRGDAAVVARLRIVNSATQGEKLVFTVLDAKRRIVLKTHLEATTAWHDISFRPSDDGWCHLFLEMPDSTVSYNFELEVAYWAPKALSGNYKLDPTTIVEETVALEQLHNNALRASATRLAKRQRYLAHALDMFAADQDPTGAALITTRK